MPTVHKPHGPYERWVKRPLGATLSVAAVVALSPVMLATAVLVRTKLGSPVLFTQNRPGKDEKIFHCGLCLPSDNKILPDQQDVIIDIVHRCFA